MVDDTRAGDKARLDVVPGADYVAVCHAHVLPSSRLTLPTNITPTRIQTIHAKQFSGLILVF